jgi:hypothetical protein
MPKLLVLALVLIASLASAAPVGAAVRAGSTEEGLDEQRPNIDGTVYQEVIRANGSYDEATGAFTVSATVNVQGKYAPPDVAFTFTRCDQAGPMPKRLIILLRSGKTEYSIARLEGYDGTIPVTTSVSGDGLTITGTASHPAFAHRDYRCVEGNSSIDDFGFFFTGWEPRALTAETATAALKARLAATYGAKYVPARDFVKCPKEEVIAQTDPADRYAGCYFEVALGGGRYAGGFTNVKLDDLTYTVDLRYVDTHTKRLHSCRGKLRTQRFANGVRISQRKLRASGAVGCSALMIGDLEARLASRYPRSLKTGAWTWMHGTNMAGFDAYARFNCRSRATAPVAAVATR